MIIVKIAEKIFSLLGTLNNPYFFLYRVCHYLNKYVPYRIAKSIYKKNLRDYKENCSDDFLIETYDGSGQAVHPDAVFFKDKYWLTITPYPYGMEEYENPCIYQGANIHDLSMPQGPIAVQKKHTQGVHLSDPCFAVDGNNLYCYYRESERKGEIEERTIWGMKYNDSQKKWGDPQLLIHSVVDKVLSPAMVFKKTGELTIYYVSSINDKYTLVSTRSNGVVNELTEHSVLGKPEDYDLWHIGISKLSDLETVATLSNELTGLFLFKSKRCDSIMKLFEVRNDGVGAVWHIVKEVEMPDEIKNIIAFPYKSCFIPKGDGAILFSFRDKKSRNRLCVLK